MSKVRRQPGAAGPKQEAAAAIARAQADLEQAVEELERLPAIDIHSVALAVHALTSFLTVTGAVVDQLVPIARDHPNPQVGIWVDGLSHATTLMSHTVSQLMNNSIGVPTTLRVEDVDLSRLLERACGYYRRSAEPKSVTVRLSLGADVPTIRTDRVLVAAVFDGLFSHALKRSPPDSSINVAVGADADGVRCSVRDEGPGTEPSSADYGLAVVRRFVNLLGGEVACESALRGGTTVTLRLPRILEAS